MSERERHDYHHHPLFFYSNNQHTIVMMAFGIGNLIARGFIYHYLQYGLKDQLSLFQTVIMVAYTIVMLINYHDDENNFEITKSVTVYFVLSILLALPAGSAYVYLMMSKLENHDNLILDSQKEMTNNWVLNMMDGGSCLALLVTAFILIFLFPEVCVNPPG